MLAWLLSVFPVAVDCMRFAETLPAAAATGDEKVEGKVIKFTVNGVVVFYKAAENSPFTASWEHLVDDGASVDGWVINIPEIVQIEVPENSVADAKLGKMFNPESYTAFNNDEIDSSGMVMQQTFTGDVFLESVRVDWDTPSKVTVFIKLREGTVTPTYQNVEIDFSRGNGRTNLPKIEYYMPTQGKMISLTVDGKDVESTATVPVVCTPAFLNVGSWARGLDVNVGGFTWFWVRMSEMVQTGHFEPNSHGYANITEPTNQIMEGLKRWKHRTVNDLDTSAELTIQSDANTVEISGNGTTLVFSKEKILGSVTKCTVGDNVIYEQAKGSKFAASWEFVNDPDAGVNGWAINIPTVVLFEVDFNSLMKSDTANLENKFTVSQYTVYPDDTDNMDELSAVRAAFQGDDKLVNEVSIKWDSHKTIKTVAHMRDGQTVEIEFSRGATTANAEHYDTAA